MIVDTTSNDAAFWIAGYSVPDTARRRMLDVHYLG